MASRVGIRFSLTVLKSNWKGLRTGPLMDALRKHNYNYMEELLRYVAKYPAQRTPPPEGRRRTTTLMHSWLIRDTSMPARISAQLENFARETDNPRHKYYARIVHGPGVGGSGQGTRPNMGSLGWKTIDQGVKEIGTRAEFADHAQYLMTKFLVSR